VDRVPPFGRGAAPRPRSPRGPGRTRELSPSPSSPSATADVHREGLLFGSELDHGWLGRWSRPPSRDGRPRASRRSTRGVNGRRGWRWIRVVAERLDHGVCTGCRPARRTGAPARRPCRWRGPGSGRERLDVDLGHGVILRCCYHAAIAPDALPGTEGRPRLGLCRRRRRIRVMWGRGSQAIARFVSLLPVRGEACSRATSNSSMISLRPAPPESSATFMFSPQASPTSFAWHGAGRWAPIKPCTAEELDNERAGRDASRIVSRGDP